MIIFLTSRREMSCSVAAPSSHSLSSLLVARPQWAIHSIPFGGRTAFQHYTAVPACRRRRNVMPGAWRRASQWIMRDFTPHARQAARAPKMWHGDARPKAARCKCGKDHPDIARTCCCPTSKAMAWHLPVAAKAVIGACSLVGNAGRRFRLQNRRKFVRCSAPAALTETPRFNRSQFYELNMSQRNMVRYMRSIRVCRKSLAVWPPHFHQSVASLPRCAGTQRNLEGEERKPRHAAS